MISAKTNWRGLGIAPYFDQAWKLPAEDALDIATQQRPGKPHIVCLGLSRIANFDDLDPLSNDPELQVTILRSGQAIPADARLVIVPGSKSTSADLTYLRAQGWDIDLKAHRRRGGHVLGICGGYQMLGNIIDDPEGIEGVIGKTEGLGLLNVNTIMYPKKQLGQVSAMHPPTQQEFNGYEIHIGQTQGPDTLRPFAQLNGRNEGAISADGLVMGSYLHGMFSSDGFRHAFLKGLHIQSSAQAYSKTVDQTLNALADHLEKHLDVSALLASAR